jgi:NAD(P) transhydrogenase
MKRFDVVVIGTGPAGQRASIQAAKLGKSVLAVERRNRVGGGALATGTIPSKTVREAVLHLTGIRQRGIYGVSYAVKRNICLADLTFRLDHVVQREVAVVEAQLARNGVELAHGKAAIAGPHRIGISGEHGEYEVETDILVLATGSEPAHTSKIPVDGVRIVDTECLMRLNTLPRTMIVVGAGVVGVEYACIFAALGVRVTLVEKRDSMLDFVDREIVDALTYHMRELGVLFRLGEEVADCSLADDRVIARTVSRKTILGDCLLYTIGRRGATDDLNLQAVGLEADERGRIAVDANYRTAVPWIYAAGDVIGFPALAATSMEQGRLAARNALGLDAQTVQTPFPYGIYTIPEISMAGPTEQELTASGVPYETGNGRYGETARGQILGDNSGRLKLLIHAETRKVLAVHIIGEGATELVHIGQALVALGGTLDYLVGAVFNYPTLAECYKIAALDAYNRLAARGATSVNAAA